jgi:hypothetical protein
LALARGLISRKFLVIDDHMIWNYRRQLEAIAAARTKTLHSRWKEISGFGGPKGD